MSSMERGSRSGEASQAAELALVPVGRSEQKSSNGNQRDGSGPGQESTHSGQLELEDIPDRPVGRPEVLGPKQLEPLFNEEQVRQAEELEASAPMLQDRRKTSLASEGTGWEGGLRREDHGGAHQELEVRARKGSGVTPLGSTCRQWASRFLQRWFLLRQGQWVSLQVSTPCSSGRRIK